MRNHRFARTLILALLLAALLLPLSSPAAAQGAQRVCILFTHDMHSHLSAQSAGEGERGGFARLSTLIAQNRAGEDAVFLFDAGDFAMGTPYQTIFSTSAAELTLMARLGYDAVTLGNHEFDYRGRGLADMLAAALDNAAEESLALPQLLCANIDWEAGAGAGMEDDARALREAFAAYGGKAYTLIERGGVKVGVFGLMGADAQSCAPLAPVAFTAAADAARQCVAALREAGADIVVCLSHSGLWSDEDKSEDAQLALAVPGIDVIVSGHTHTTLPEPLRRGDTWIASCGDYTANLGRLTLEKGADGLWSLADYALLPTSDDVAPDPQIEAALADYRALVGSEYLYRYGYDFDQILCRADFDITQGGGLGDLLTDALVAAVQAAEGDDYAPIALAVVPTGVIRGDFPRGDITVPDAFNVLSLGIGPDRVPGYPLVSIYLTGRELYDLAEVDASVSQLMGGTNLFVSGGGFAFHPNRLLLSRVSDVWVYDQNGEKQPVEKDKLYRVVADLYSGQMLGAVRAKSFGLLSLAPKNADGSAVTDFEDNIIYAPGGDELKAWVALADYLYALGDADGTGAVPQSYAASAGRKEVSKADSLGDFLRHSGRIVYLLAGVVLALIAIIVGVALLSRALVRRHKKKKRARRQERENAG